MKLFNSNNIIYETMNKNDSIEKAIMKILDNKSGALIMNTLLEEQLNTMLRIHKADITVKILSAIKTGEIVLIKLPLENNLPDMLPFITYNKSGKDKVIINLTKYISEKKTLSGDDPQYEIAIQKLYVLCLTAYFALKMNKKTTHLSSSNIITSSRMWARMFNKVLNKAIGLNTNKDRYEAFMYFGIKFFILYYLEEDMTLANNVANGYLKNGKSHLILYMEDKIETLNLDPFESFKSFCTTLFNNEVSNIKGIRVNNIEESINVTFYFARFIDMFSFTAVSSLLSYPYFIFNILAAYFATNMNSNRSFEDIVQYDNKEVPILLGELKKM